MHFTRFQKLAAGVATGGLVLYVARRLRTQMPLSKAMSTKAALDPQAFKAFELGHIEMVSHDTKLYRFKLDTPGTVLDMPVASCLLTKIDGPTPDKPTIRPYTPVSLPGTQGHFDLVIKTYPDGAMSRHFDALKPGDKVEMKGPIPKIPIKPGMANAIGMVAGGTGITPMYQVVQEILRQPDNKTKVTLLFGNKSTKDILLKDNLDELARQHPDTFAVHYIIDKSEDGWTGLTGFVNADVVRKYLPPPVDGNMVFVCGPPGMMTLLSGGKKSPAEQGPLTGVLAELGYTPSQVYKF